jgi:hypothetical protein
MPTERSPSGDRAEIVEDRPVEEIHVYVFSGPDVVARYTDELIWDYADADMDEIAKKIAERHGVPPGQIARSVRGGRGTRPIRRRLPRGRSRR